MTFSPGVAPPQPVARRAASHQAPENTRATISKALTLGIDVIELDGRLSRDGIPVLSHDATLDRTANAAAPPVIDVIRRSRVEDGVIISGRTAPRAGEVRRLAPDVHLLLNHRPSSPATDGEPPHSPDGSIAAALRLGAVGVNLDHRHVTDEFRLAAHDAGLQVWAYTVDNQPGYQALIACGVDFITSNWPDEMLPLLNGRRQSHPIQ